MLVLLVLASFALLIVFIFGVMFPTRVFLGPTATREKVMKFYGWPALAGLILSIVLGPSDKSTTESGQSATTSKSPEPDEGRLLPVTFSGITLPGHMLEAKTTGFTDCTSDHYGYTCRRTVPTQLLGITAQDAVLTLDGKDHYADAYFTPEKYTGDVRKLPAEELAYGTITATFAKAEYDSKCVDKYREAHGGFDSPASCIQNKNTIVHLSQALHDAGWLPSRSRRGYQHFVHPDQLIEVTTKDDTASLHRVSASSVQETVERAITERTAKEAAEANANNVVEQMKQ